MSNRTFVTKEDLITHTVQEHPLDNNVLNKNVCTVCGVYFQSVEPLISHIFRIHHLIDEPTLATTEAGHQLVKIWQEEKSNCFKCYDCGKDVGEKSNIINHKQAVHYKQKKCKNFHENNYYRFSPRDCVYYHRLEERQWQYAGGQQGAQGSRQTGGGDWMVCRNGPGCSWLANQRCMFKHENSSVPVTETTNTIPVNNVTQGSSSSTIGNTLESSMKAIMDRLGELEKRMPPVINLSGFPPMEGGKKNQ